MFCCCVQDHGDYIRNVNELADFQVFDDNETIAPEDKKKAESAVPGKPSYAIQAVN